MVTITIMVTVTVTITVTIMVTFTVTVRVTVTDTVALTVTVTVMITVTVSARSGQERMNTSKADSTIMQPQGGKVSALRMNTSKA